MSEGVALITGASSGIGRATAELFAAHGWRTYGASRSSAPTDTAGEQPVKWLMMNVTDDESVARAVGTVIAAEQRLDLVVNSAGYGLAGSLEDTTVEEALRQFDTNFFGTMRVTKAVLPQLRKQGGGLIVNIGSLGGIIGLPFQAVYSATKFALEGLTEALRQEVARYGIRVVLVEPGDVRTNITANRVVATGAGNGSVYESQFRTTLQIVENDERAGVAPDVVSRLIVQLARRPAPPVRIRVGRFAQTSSVLVKRALGSRNFERLLMAHYGLR